jgi:type 1 glutamine amidotransferase
MLLGLAFIVMAAAPISAAESPKAADLPPVTSEQKQKIAAAAPGSGEAAKPLRPRHVLIFSRADGWVHRCIPVAVEALVEIGRSSGAYAAVASDDLAMFTPERLAAFDAIVLNNTTRLVIKDPAQKAALLDFVQNGGGLAGIHAAADNFADWPDGGALIGAQFASHAWGSRGTWAVKIDDPGHPVTAPFHGRGFWINDEIYELTTPYSRDTHHVLLSLDMTQAHNRSVKPVGPMPGDFPVAWVKRAGRGRVFYSSLGHNLEIYWNPIVLRHYLAGIQYALGDLAATDLPSASLQPGPVPALAPAGPPPGKIP